MDATGTQTPTLVPGPRTGPGVAREALAQNVRRHRLARGWSLRELGAATGISKGLLSQIERAEANPTLEILTRLADVLATTCTDLLRRPLLRPEIVRAADPAEEPGETSVHFLFAQGELGRAEFYRSRLHPHAQSQVSSHGTDSVEYVTVVSGRVVLVVDGERYALDQGDTARFSGLSSHHYETEESTAVTHTVVGYPRD
ncbi:helix-turn-helix domain-containing protein [Streptomyces albidoflavus]|uniref:helix-turn-helix domain-containing protein n=1 Tax=Streptomyces albidoflavus TaxID=1886 RepID=UPI0033DB3186